MFLLLAVYNTLKAMETAITCLSSLIISVCSDVRLWQFINTHIYAGTRCVTHLDRYVLFISNPFIILKQEEGISESLVMEDLHITFTPESEQSPRFAVLCRAGSRPACCLAQSHTNPVQNIVPKPIPKA